MDGRHMKFIFGSVWVWNMGYNSHVTERLRKDVSFIVNEVATQLGTHWCAEITSPSCFFFKNLSDWKIKFKTIKREIEHALRHPSGPSNKKRKTYLTQFKCQAHPLTRIRCSFVKDLNSSYIQLNAMKARYRISMVLLDSVPPPPSPRPDAETNKHSLSQLGSEWASEQVREWMSTVKHTSETSTADQANECPSTYVPILACPEL